MSGKNGIIKWFLKTWSIKDYYLYDIYQVNAGNDIWFEAVPKTPGVVTRTAETEQILKIILENDCINAIKFQKQRTR